MKRTSRRRQVSTPVVMDAPTPSRRHSCVTFRRNIGNSPRIRVRHYRPRPASWSPSRTRRNEAPVTPLPAWADLPGEQKKGPRGCCDNADAKEDSRDGDSPNLLRTQLGIVLADSTANRTTEGKKAYDPHSDRPEPDECHHYTNGHVGKIRALYEALDGLRMMLERLSTSKHQNTCDAGHPENYLETPEQNDSTLSGRRSSRCTHISRDPPATDHENGSSCKQERSQNRHKQREPAIQALPFLSVLSASDHSLPGYFSSTGPPRSARSGSTTAT